MESLKNKRIFFKRFKNPIIELENFELALDVADNYSKIDYVKFTGTYDFICHRRKLPLL
jgi:hypothetical protein